DLVEIFLTGITTKAGGPIQADLNSQLNNMDVNPAKFRPSEMLRLNLGVPVTANPSRLGVLGGDLQGFPNGRRLTDDVVDIELQALEGAAQTGKLVDALATGDGVDASDDAFGKSFPYVALPNIGKPASSSPVRPNNGPNARGKNSGGLMNNEPQNASFSSSSGGSTVVTASASAVAVALAAVLIVGWFMRRRRLTPALATAAASSPPDPSGGNDKTIP